MKKIVKLSIGLIISLFFIFICKSTYAAYTTSGEYTYNDLDDGTISIVEYKGNSKNVEVPSTIDSKKVTKLELWAFKDNSTVTTIVLPEGLTTIEAYAFDGCSNLTTIKLPSTLNYISRLFIEECPKLTNYTIPEGLTKISNGDYQRVVSVNINGKYNYDMAKEAVELANQERKKEGLEPLKIDNSLMESAMLRAAELSIYYKHARPDGAEIFSVNNKVDGENIGCGTYIITASKITEEWMNSPGHKAQILKYTYKSIGIGCYISNGRSYWVQLFSRDNSSNENTLTGEKEVNNKIQVATDKGYINPKIEGLKDINTLAIGETLSPTSVKNVNAGYNYNYTNIALSDLTWKSSNENIFTVDKNGTIKAKNIGNAVLTASIGEYIATFNVSVIIPLKSIDIEKNVTLETGNTYQLTVKYNPTNTTENTNVTWSSNDSSVAIVNSKGLVTAIGKGTATITAKVGEHTANCEVTVKLPYLKGDMDKNGEITAYDAYLVNLIYEDGRIPTDEELEIGDIDGNGELTAFDAFKINVAYENGEMLE